MTQKFGVRFPFSLPSPTFKRLPYLLFAAGLFALGNLAAVAAPAAAAKPPKQGPDLLVFTNGDKLTGKLDHEAGGKIFFTSDNAGSIQVPWASIKELHTAEPFAVLQTGFTVKRKDANSSIPVGTLSITDDTVSVATASGSQQIPVKTVEYLVDKATFDKNVLHTQHWDEGIAGSVSAGASTVSSTQNSESYNTGIALTRGVPPVAWMPARQRTVLAFTSTYGKISQPNTPTLVTNILHADLEEDEYFNPRFYVLEQAIYDHNSTQGLDLQQLYGGGVGFTVIKNANQELDVTATVNYTMQQFAAPIPAVTGQAAPATQNLIGSNFGNNYTRKLPKNIVLTEAASITPEWNVPADYSANAMVGATLPIFKNFGLSVAVIDSYLNDPTPGFQGNSLQFNTGLTYSIP